MAAVRVCALSFGSPLDLFGAAAQELRLSPALAGLGAGPRGNPGPFPVSDDIAGIVRPRRKPAEGNNILDSVGQRTRAFGSDGGSRTGLDHGKRGRQASPSLRAARQQRQARSDSQRPRRSSRFPLGVQFCEANVQALIGSAPEAASLTSATAPEPVGEVAGQLLPKIDRPTLKAWIAAFGAANPGAPFDRFRDKAAIRGVDSTT